MLARPTPLWLSILILCFCFVAIGGAATTLYTGSFSVISGGTYTDSNQTASTCARYNGSKQLVSAFGDCASGTVTSVGGTSPIVSSGGNTPSLSCSTCVTTAGGQTINGTLITTGLLTGAGLTAGTGTVKGASDGTTNTYLPPGYTNSGAALGSTFHIAIGGCTLAGTLCTVTFSGAAVFSSSTTYGCSVSLPGGAASSANTYFTEPQSGTTLTVSGSTNVAVTVVCAGT